MILYDFSFRQEVGPTLIAELFENCLFSLPTKDTLGPLSPPKCKRPRTRSIAFQLLHSLCLEAPANYVNLTRRLLDQYKFNTVVKSPEWFACLDD